MKNSMVLKLKSLPLLQKIFAGSSLFLFMFAVFGFLVLPPVLKSILIKKLSDEPSNEVMQRFAKIGTIDMRVDFIRPGRGKYFLGTGTPLRTGNKIAVNRMELRNDEDKLIDIVRKTWKKMSADAHAFALSGKLKLPEPLVPLITKALLPWSTRWAARVAAPA